jgi:hypothetical protein
MQFVFGGFARDLVLFAKPRTEIDEPAALAAERSIQRVRGPLNATPAGRAFDDRSHGDAGT